MKRWMGMSSGETGKNTLGDLIVALTDETARFVDDEEEVYRVVAYIVSDLLCNSRPFSRWWH